MYNAFIAPYQSVTITPNDTTTFSYHGYIVVSTTGVIVARLAGDTADVTIPVIAGLPYWGSWKQIKSTGHTAGNVIALIYRDAV